ncbi:MAG: hypothetical protein EHM70_14520 [Chloroflexota bacterium]|nr:MAG: hypothetical protein EHM70_14520 [Chloroflexota bacterium]
MDPAFGKTWFRIAFFITLLAAVILPFQKPGTAEFVVSVLTLGIGLVFLLLIVIIVRRSGGS